MASAFRRAAAQRGAGGCSPGAQGRAGMGSAPPFPTAVLEAGVPGAGAGGGEHLERICLGEHPQVCGAHGPVTTSPLRHRVQRLPHCSLLLGVSRGAVARPVKCGQPQGPGCLSSSGRFRGAWPEVRPTSAHTHTQAGTHGNTDPHAHTGPQTAQAVLVRRPPLRLTGLFIKTP